MVKDALIAKQQLQIEKLKEEREIYKSHKANIRLIVYSTGAPLNGNQLNYSDNQLQPFYDIINCLNI